MQADGIKMLFYLATSEKETGWFRSRKMES